MPRTSSGRTGHKRSQLVGWTNGPMNGWKEGVPWLRTDGQPENIMPPLSKSVGIKFNHCWTCMPNLHATIFRSTLWSILVHRLNISMGYIRLFCSLYRVFNYDVSNLFRYKKSMVSKAPSGIDWCTSFMLHNRRVVLQLCALFVNYQMLLRNIRLCTCDKKGQSLWINFQSASLRKVWRAATV